MGDLLSGVCREVIQAPESSPGLVRQSHNPELHLIRFSALLTKEMRPIFLDLGALLLSPEGGGKGWLLTQPQAPAPAQHRTGPGLGLGRWAFVEAELFCCTGVSVEFPFFIR